MNLNVDKVYICHYKKLIERKQSVLDQLNNQNITNYEFVELYDKDYWNIEEIESRYPSINKCSMTDGEKSLALKHIWIIEELYNKKYDSIMVFEDDVVLCDNFVDKFNFYKTQMPADWDIGWVGSCFHLKEPDEPNKNVYKTNRGSRCTHAFCLSKSFSTKVLDEIKFLNKPSDHYYNYLVKKFNLNNYWFQPALAFQSLKFCSALNSNPEHKWDPKEMG